MNSAFRNTARKALAQQKRFASSAPTTEHAFMKARLNPPSFKTTWLSDPTTYPIMVVVGFACTMTTVVGMTYLTRSKDVTWDTSKRGSVLRTWGENPNRFGN